MDLKESDKQRNRLRKLWLYLKKEKKLTNDSRLTLQRQTMKSKRSIVMVNTMKSYIKSSRILVNQRRNIDKRTMNFLRNRKRSLKATMQMFKLIFDANKCRIE